MGLGVFYWLILTGSLGYSWEDFRFGVYSILISLVVVVLVLGGFRLIVTVYGWFVCEG